MTHALPRAGVRRLRPQLIALAAASLCSAAFAQEAAKPADKSPEMKELEAVVVTGTARREGVRKLEAGFSITCLLYTSPSPRDQRGSRMPSSA